MAGLDTVEERIAAINDKLRTQLFRKGAKSLKGLARIFRVADFSGNGLLDPDEFEEALSQGGLFLKSNELSMLFKYYDSSGDGNISYDEFVTGLAPPLSARRAGLVEKVFAQMDRDGSGVINGKDVNGVYDAKQHPSVKKGEKTEDQVLGEFLNGFEGARGNQDGQITIDEWTGYYRDLSASIPSDDYFVAMMESVWGVIEDGKADPMSKRVDSLLEILKEKVRQKTTAGNDEKTTLKRAFQHFDKDESGAVTPDEFSAALNTFGIQVDPKENRAFFQRFDPDRSGSITYKEFGGSLFDVK